MLTEPRLRADRYLSLALAFSPPRPPAGDDLILAYTRLFLGPGRPIVSPYESVHVNGHLLGEAAVRVARCYQEAGLEVRPAERELPDHVSLELAFMAYLAEQENLDPGRAERWRHHQRRFLEQHLGRWLPDLCQHIDQGQVHPFYRRAARDASELIQEELKRLIPRVAGGERLPTRPTQNLPTNGDPGRSISRRTDRYPNIQLTVDLSACTLCTLCADNCRPGALTVLSSPASLSLRFDPAHCNGCRACLRMCPEKAIAIRRGPRLETAPISASNLLASAARVICPGCQQPHVAQPWLERLADRLGGEAEVYRSLQLCPFCKAAPTNVSTRPVGWSQGSRGHGY